MNISRHMDNGKPHITGNKNEGYWAMYRTFEGGGASFDKSLRSLCKRIKSGEIRSIKIIRLGDNVKF